MNKELIEQLRTHNDDRLYFEADVLMSEAADLIERLTTENENLLLANRDCVDHFNAMKDDLAAAQKRIELYEQALLASWPEGAMGDAFDYWNAARKEYV